MPNHQKHRGQHSDDVHLFNDKWMPILCQAVRDFSHLLTLGYPDHASLKLVGDRFRLNKRQRKAVMRSGCANQSVWERQKKECALSDLNGSAVVMDAYNVLITTESLLSDGIILDCRDGCFRDLASLHGTYRKVEETIPAIQLIGQALETLGVQQVRWYLDSPISNSGRLKGLILEEAQQQGWNWEAELVANPDKDLVISPEIVISSDSWVIDQSRRWFNLMAYLISLKKGILHIRQLK